MFFLDAMVSVKGILWMRRIDMDVKLIKRGNDTWLLSVKFSRDKITMMLENQEDTPEGRQAIGSNFVYFAEQIIKSANGPVEGERFEGPPEVLKENLIGPTPPPDDEGGLENFDVSIIQRGLNFIKMRIKGKN